MTKKETLLKKLSTNKCSKQELEVLFDLIQKEDAGTPPQIMMTLLEQMKEVPQLDSEVSDRILGKVLQATTATEVTLTQEVAPFKIGKRVNWIGRVAAVFLVLIMAGGLVFQYLNPSELVVKTDYNERKEVNLPDGSKVTLNANSKLQYFADWSAGETRIVKLEGEAYFEVEKKITSNTKFQVLTEDLTVEVLGTIFNVNTRQEATKIYLEEGKVKLNLEDEKSSELFLKPGEVVSYSAKRKLLLSPHQVTNEIEVSWKDGFLTFEDTSLKDILEELTQTTNLEFEIKTVEMANRKWNLALPNDNITEAMSILSSTTGHEIKKVGNKYVLMEKK